jgi:uncharacterized protein
MSAETTGPSSQHPDETNKSNAPVAGSPEAELTADLPPRPVDATAAKPRRPRGFAAMDRKLVSEIARKGGKAAHTAGTAHEFTSDEARAAGSKGGRATHAKRRKAVEDHQS